MGAWILLAMVAMGSDQPAGTLEELPLKVFAFGQSDVSKLPAGWKAEHTGKGEGSIWKVVADESAPSGNGAVLAQTAESPKAFFNLCVVEDSHFKDLELQVAFKAVQGKNDQGGGLVWRYRDHDNYYIARMNPLEDNFRVYRVVAGKRKQLQSRDGLKVKAGEWHTIKIDMEGDHIRCYFDGEKMLDVKDETFKDSGKIGLWSKSDAQTNFDHLEVRGR
jgi:3-keto-disaccharide hydrolase